MSDRSHAWWAALASALAVLAACSADSSTKVPATRSPALLELAVEARGERSVVAEVNGVPIYGDCVKRQAEAHRISKSAALEECIEFELLSLAASEPRIVALADVQEPAKQELVRSFIESNYPYTSADALPEELVRGLWKQTSPSRYNYPEIRDIVFCRVSPPKGATKDSEESQRARKYLTGVYERLKERKSMEQDDLFEACYGPIDLPEGEERPYTKAGIKEIKLQTFRPTPRADYQVDFQKVVFDGPEEAGMVLPPMVSPYGWDLILLTKIIPAKTTAYAEAEPELRRALFEEAVYEPQREALFQEWYAPLEAKHKVVRSYQALPQGQAPTTEAPPAPGGQP